MKFTWGVSDIKPGLEVIRPPHTTLYVIGYYISINDDKKYCLIDLRDGAVGEPRTKDELTAALNRSGYVPRYTFEPHG